MNIIDTHIHLDRPDYKKTLDEVLARAEAAGIDRIIIPAIYSNQIDGIVMLCEKYSNLYFSTGHHPDFRHLESFDITLIEKYVAHEKCVAIGECGIDFYRAPEHGKDAVIAKQKEIFQLQIDLALKYDKPIIIHSRDASDVVVSMLAPHIPKLRGVIHCFVGDAKLLELQESFYFGIGGVITYKTATDLRTNIKKVPIDRMVLETDGPYLTPRKYGKVTNESAFIPEIIREMASLTGMYPSKIIDNCYKNSERLFFNK